MRKKAAPAPLNTSQGLPSLFARQSYLGRIADDVDRAYLTAPLRRSLLVRLQQRLHRDAPILQKPISRLPRRH